MNNIIKNTLTAVALSAIAAGAAGAAHAAGALAKDTFKVGTDLTYPPYNYFDSNNKPAGFDGELMTALAKAANHKVEFLDTRFENLIIGARGGQFDVIASTLYVKA